MRDLIVIRPEYIEEYLTLAPGDARDHVLGVVWIDDPAYDSTPGHTGERFALVAETYLGECYPIDEEDLLE